MQFLGKNIQFLRKNEEKSQREFAQLLDKGQSTIANWENGVSYPSIKELCFLSEHFGVSTDKLLNTDLAAAALSAEEKAANTERAPGEVKPYDPVMPESMVREDAQMAYLLEEVRILRQDIDEIRTKQEEGSR